MNLYTDEQISLARRRVAEDKNAKRLADNILSSSKDWLDRNDALIRSIMPDPDVPRTWSVNYMTGCPVHGSGPEGYGGYAQGGWRHDPFTDKWKVTCGVGGESYPSNDFGLFLDSGMRDQDLLTGPYADDGWGWQGDTPYRHWFVAYCSGNMWTTALKGLADLSQSYLITGDTRYAHKALVILDRIAEVYADMDYYKQSMYATEFSPGYDGKIDNLINETSTMPRICSALDAVRDTLPDDPVFGPTAEATGAKLKKGIVDASLEGVYDGQIRGNYGGHQEAILVAALVSGDEQEIERAVDWVMNNTGEATRHKEMLTHFDGYVFRDRAAHAEGINFALDNLIFREGIGWETSPGYNSGWIHHLTNIAAILDDRGVRLWDRPKFRRMYRWPSEMSVLGTFSPAIGDMGGVGGGAVGLRPETMRTAYRATKDPFLGELLKRSRTQFDSFSSLFEEEIEVTPEKEGSSELKSLTVGSRLMGGYGLALLRSNRTGTAISMYYGRAATEHAHFDRLNIELFAFDKKLIPDLGYPEHAAEGDRPAVWTKNTLSHATVVVDGRRQDTQAPGKLTQFVDTDGLSLVEVDAPDTYHHTSEYRRTLALVDIGEDASYVLDLFRVSGGSQHDYSFHGFAGDFSVDGLDLGEVQEKGTLAGENVEYGAIYDDRGLSDPRNKSRSYYTYAGGGYSYLYNVRRGVSSGPWSATWKDAESGVGLRSTFQDCWEAISAHGDPPRKPGNPKQLDYLVLRNSGESVRSRYTCVHEPFRDEPKVRSVEVLEQDDGFITLKIVHRDGEDLIRHGVSPDGSTFSLTRTDIKGVVTEVHQIGTGSSNGAVKLSIEKGISGEIAGIDVEGSILEFARDRKGQPIRPTGLKGEVAVIGNSRRSAAYYISEVERTGRKYAVRLGGESLCIGRIVIGELNSDGSGLSTGTNLYLAAQGYYRGAWLTNEEADIWLPIEDVTLAPHKPGMRRDAGIRLVGRHDLASHFTPGQLAFIFDIGPGDRLSVVPHASAVLRKDGSYRMKGNGRAALV